MQRPVLYVTALLTAVMVPSFAAAASHRDDGDENGKEQAQERVMETTQKHQDTLSDVRNETPEEANQGIDRAMERSSWGMEESRSALDRSTVSPDTRSTGRMDSMNGGRGMSGGAGGRAGGPTR